MYEINLVFISELQSSFEISQATASRARNLKPEEDTITSIRFKPNTIKQLYSQGQKTIVSKVLSLFNNEIN
jgi:hypothetical protein